MHQLPEWTDALRPEQEDAVAKVLDHYARGTKMVVLDGPTGTGKTLIAEVVRQELGVPKALYVCSDKSLQAQFAHDFIESRVVMGRRNYRPTKIDHIGSMELTCDDCTGPACGYCESQRECPYMEARVDALRAPVAVLNTAYYLAVMNGTKLFQGRGLTVFDECDTLEGYLLGWAQINISGARCRAVGTQIPVKGAHWKTVEGWIRTDLIPSVQAKILSLNPADPDARKEAEGWRRWVGDLTKFLASRRADEPWIKETHGQSLTLRPVLVAGFGQRGIWSHGGATDRWLLMSATVLSPGVMLRELGWDQDWQVVRVPMTFPVENRPIYNLPLARVTAKAEEHELERLSAGVVGAVDRHRRESVLVHTVSYRLTQRIVKALEGTGRRVHFYLRSEDRQAAVEAFSHDPGSVMVAPSLDRGVDFVGDMCRVQIIAKVPYPNMGDKRVSERLRAEGGQAWFDVQTIRTLVQMTGRGVRSADDTAVTYILDSMFSTIHSRHRDVFPLWWTEALSTPFQPLDLLKPIP